MIQCHQNAAYLCDEELDTSMKLTVDRRPNPTRSDSPPAKDQANSPCPQRDFGTVLRELNPVHRGTVGNSSDKARRTLASSCRNCTHSWHVWWGP